MPEYVRLGEVLPSLPCLGGECHQAGEAQLQVPVAWGGDVWDACLDRVPTSQGMPGNCPVSLGSRGQAGKGRASPCGVGRKEVGRSVGPAHHQAGSWGQVLFFFPIPKNRCPILSL